MGDMFSSSSGFSALLQPSLSHKATFLYQMDRRLRHHGRECRLLNLPSEILFIILENMPPEQFISLAIANYVQLQFRARHLLPPLSARDWIKLRMVNNRYLHHQQTVQAGQAGQTGPPAPVLPLHSLPLEILLQVLETLPHSAQINLAVADWYRFCELRIVQPITSSQHWRELKLAGLMAWCLKSSSQQS